ncbi:MAG: 4a-hydroxytetrahydrobiopterin dehydratase [Thiotrichales bacterium]
MQSTSLDDSWMETKKTASLTRRFEFDSYSSTRVFLDQLADLSEEQGYYPNLNFNRTQVNVSIESETGKLGEKEYEFAQQTQKLFDLKDAVEEH